MAYNPANTAEEMVTQQTTSMFSPNKAFIKSLPGILKIVELVCDIIIWICVGSSHFGISSNGGFVNFTASITFIFTLFLFVSYTFRLIYRYPGPWILIETASLVISIFLFAICILVSALSHSFGGSAIASAVFCCVNAIIYGVEMFMRFRISMGPGMTVSARAVDGDIAVKPTTHTPMDQDNTGNPSGGVASTTTGYSADPYAVP